MGNVEDIRIDFIGGNSEQGPMLPRFIETETDREMRAEV